MKLSLSTFMSLGITATTITVLVFGLLYSTMSDTTDNVATYIEQQQSN